MEFQLEQRNGPVRLVHITTEDRIPSIQAHGLLPSEYGDLQVENNDGAGIYAVRPEKEAIASVVDLFAGIHNEELYAVSFDYTGSYFECTGVLMDEDDLEEYGDKSCYKGYIVLPVTKNSPNVVVDPKSFISVVPVHFLLKELSAIGEFHLSQSTALEGSVNMSDLKIEINQELDFIFDEEITISDDYTNLEGYLWATDTLVSRLQKQEPPLSEDQSMENINFYPVYNLETGTVELDGHYWLEDGYSGTGKGFSLPLTENEASRLITGFEEYCKKTEGVSCLEFLNSIRRDNGLECLGKKSLDEQIQSASARSSSSLSQNLSNIKER